MADIEQFILDAIERIQNRNGGNCSNIHLDLKIMDESLKLDSLDLAEIVAGVEERFGVLIFDQEGGIESWRDVKEVVLRQSDRERSGELGGRLQTK